MATLYRIEQAFTDQTVVVVDHALGQRPHVTVLDAAGQVILPDSILHDSILHDSLDRLTVTFLMLESGTIIASL